MIEVYKTNVQNIMTANFIINCLKEKLPNCKINFDLEDCDKILRIEGKKINNNNIVSHLNRLGFVCVEL